MPRGTCTAAGKTKDAARATCQTKNLFCYVGDQPKKAKKGKKKAKKAKK